MLQIGIEIRAPLKFSATFQPSLIRTLRYSAALDPLSFPD
jgi:hypothetical protein